MSIGTSAHVSYYKKPQFTHNVNSLIPFMRSEAFCFIGLYNITLKSHIDIAYYLLVGMASAGWDGVQAGLVGLSLNCNSCTGLNKIKLALYFECLFRNVVS